MQNNQDNHADPEAMLDALMAVTEFYMYGKWIYNRVGMENLVEIPAREVLKNVLELGYSNFRETVQKYVAANR